MHSLRMIPEEVWWRYITGHAHLHNDKYKGKADKAQCIDERHGWRDMRDSTLCTCCAGQ
jgi:hypothetical protein